MIALLLIEDLLWSGWAGSLAIVQPNTVVRWHRAGFRIYWNWLSRCGERSGRPPLPLEVRALIKRMASENSWGAPRTHGELLRLGFEVSERSVSRYLRALPRSPRAGQTWTTFLRNHRDVIRCLGRAAASRGLSVRFGTAFPDLRPRCHLRSRGDGDAAVDAD